MTRISISNIAWDVRFDGFVADLLSSLDVHHVDIAPGKYFPNPEEATDADILAVRRTWEERGFAPAGFQSLLFGTKGLNVFGPKDVRERMLARLFHVCRVAAGLGAGRLVFGSPKNRDRSGLSDEETRNVALDFFGRLGNVARSFGVAVCLEPNPVAYGANFLTTTREAYDFVAALDHPGIRLQLDTGTLFMNCEPPGIIATVLDRVGHVHVSEPDLVPLGEAEVDHAPFGLAFREALAKDPSSVFFVTIEMLVKDGNDASVSDAERRALLEQKIRRAVELVRANYLPGMQTGQSRGAQERGE